jgi:hypothetical protein
LPTPGLPLKHVKFELNLQKIFDERYWQYYYSQIPPVLIRTGCLANRSRQRLPCMRISEAGSSSFLKKRTKKLLSVRAFASPRRAL